MPDLPAITVENLGKRYVIGHERRPDTLRDSLAQGARGFWRRWFSGQGTPEREDFWALRDVSFEVPRGEVIGIIGRNGAGKSTLLKILSRITEPTTGRAVIRGRVASLLEVGTGFHPELTGRENIFLNGAILGMTRAEIARKFDEIVAFAEVERFLDTPVKRYSSGMYVRLAFAVAAHLEPEILIVDEVLAVGDAAFQKKCLGKMQDVARNSGRTVLFVSHSMSAIQALCGCALYLAAGRVREIGRTETIIERYSADSASQSTSAPFANRELVSGLQLVRLEFDPKSPSSLGPAGFSLALRATRRASLTDLSIIINTTTGTRVALLDLRRSQGPRTLGAGTELTIEGGIPSLPIVEGTYTLGLHVATAEDRADIDDIVAVQVNGAAGSGPVSRYAARYRGYAEIHFTVSNDSITPALHP